MTTTNSCVCVCIIDHVNFITNAHPYTGRRTRFGILSARARVCTRVIIVITRRLFCRGFFYAIRRASRPILSVRTIRFDIRGEGGEGFFVVIFASINVDDLSRPNIRATRASLSAARSRHGNRSPLPLPIPLYVPTVRGGRKPPEWPRERTESAGRTRFSRHPKIIINSQPTPC